ncbi:MAG: hypothetical protein M3430_03020, partial [Acidobacteriota bacterium]|nr:hypothetical protein [Acidobacteriota bacterium]
VRPCGANFKAVPEDKSDNARSVVFLLSYGDFQFFDGGDLTWNTEHKLACPKNLAGEVDVYQVNHHGLDTSNNPSLIEALKPRVAIINNGPRKGGQPRTFATLKSNSSVEAIFQLHRNVLTGDSDNAPADHVANDAENCQAAHVKLTVAPDGKTYHVEIPSKNVRRSFTTR